MFFLRRLLVVATLPLLSCQEPPVASETLTITTGGPTTTGTTASSMSVPTGDETVTSAEPTTDGPTTTTTTTPTSTGTTTDFDPSTATTVVPAMCGDGIVDPGEACDDSNADDTDACTNICSLAMCGDGIVHAGVEACDDGNKVDDDGCTNGCASPTCGDGLVQPGEVCDLGGDNSNTGTCTLACLLPVCGDGFVQPSAGEACDDKNGDDHDDCPGTCQPASCGDGFLHTGVEACDDGNLKDSDACTGACKAAVCGDGYVQAGVETCDAAGESPACDADCSSVKCGDGVKNAKAGESCDDGNAVSGDGCEPDCLPSLRTIPGYEHTCVLLAGGVARCWGKASEGALGNESGVTLGDNPGELPVANIDAGGKVTEVAAGALYTCVLLDTGVVRCFGDANNGKLGYGNLTDLGDDPGEMPTPDVPIGASVARLAGQFHHMCVVTKAGGVRCWGNGYYGQLGDGGKLPLGDQPGELPVPDIPLAGQALDVTAGGYHSCALLAGGVVRCWGRNLSGQLGYGHTNSVGDDPGEMPSPVVALGGAAVAVTAGNVHTCALMAGGTVRCWGEGLNGQLGGGNSNDLGDQPGEMPPPEVMMGGLATYIEAGLNETCALLEDDSIKCWGAGVGNDPGEMPPPAVKIYGNVIKPAARIGVGSAQKCAVLFDASLHCWGGDNLFGQLGYGHTMQVAANQAGPVPY